MTTVAELLDYPTLDEIRALLLTWLTKPWVPITDWSEGAVVRTQYEIDATVTKDLVDAIAIQVAEGFLGTPDEKGADGDWLTTLAYGWYGLTRGLPSVPTQTLTLTCAAGDGPYNVVAGSSQAIATDGARYVALTGGTVSNGSPLSVDWIAESPGAARGLISTLVPSLKGVTLSSVGIKAVAGIPQFGADEERDASLFKRCDDRWPDTDFELDAEDRVVRWVKAASAEITRTRIDPDPDNPGGVLITVAGSAGPVSSGAVTTAQAYVDERAPITDWDVVQNSTTVGIYVSGTVTAAAALIPKIAAAADAAWLAYLGAAQIGSAVFLSKLIQVVMDAGAIDFTDYKINGHAADLGPPDMPANGVPVPAASPDPVDPALLHSLTWNGI